MPITTWIRDLFGIRKDYVDTEKSVLEIEKLEAEKRERDLITPATLDDVKRYDPKIRAIEQQVESPESLESQGPAGIGCMLILGLIGYLLFKLIQFLIR